MLQRFSRGQHFFAETYCCVCHQRRFARKRSVQKSDGAAVADVYSGGSPDHAGGGFTPSMAGLRSGGMMAAPSVTSLDNIRSQVRAMKEEAQEKRERAELSRRSETEDEAERHRRLTTALIGHLARRHKPDDAYYNGKDARERVEMRAEVVKRTLLNEVDEVVRKSKKSDTLHFLQLAFPLSVLDSTKVVAVAEQLRTECQATLSALKKALPERAVSQADLRERAWLDVLESKSADELRFIWQSGLLDLSDVEHLLTTPGGSSDGSNGASASAVASASHATTGGEQGVVEPAPAEGETGLLIQDCVEQLHDIQYLQELAKELSTGVVSGSGSGPVASVDLAPVLQKVHEKRYNDITERDLQILESYEETPISLSAEAKSQANSTVTQSLVDRALSPSNRLLFYMATKDEKVHRSLEALERIKRQALFDPVFQEAVRAAHQMEEVSVDGHVRGASDPRAPDSSHAQRLRSVMGKNGESSADGEGIDTREEGQAAAFAARSALSPRQQRASRHRAAALYRPHHAADVPYFFGDARSIVPPRGNFNLPKPALSPEERAARRGQRRRTRGRTRFSK